MLKSWFLEFRNLILEFKMLVLRSGDRNELALIEVVFV